MKRKSVQIGARVKSLVDYYHVPAGTEGVIDELYDGGFMVAWDGAEGHTKLPRGYHSFAERHRGSWRWTILRDGFNYREIGTLELVRPPKPRPEPHEMDSAMVFP